MGDRTFSHLKSYLVAQWARTQTTGNPMRAAFAGHTTVTIDSNDEATSKSTTVCTAAAAHVAENRSAEDYKKEIATLKNALKVTECYCFSCEFGSHFGITCNRTTKVGQTGPYSHSKLRIPRTPFTDEMIKATEPKTLKDADGKTCKGNVGVEKGYRKK